MIVETKLNNLDNKPIKVNKKTPPMSVNKDLTPLYFTDYNFVYNMLHDYTSSYRSWVYTGENFISPSASKHLSPA
jgi:hypothetical protein